MMQLKLDHDVLARLALVRPSRDEFTRPVSKLRRLPVKDNDLHNANVERYAHNEKPARTAMKLRAVENVNAKVTHDEPPGRWFEQCTRTPPTSLWRVSSDFLSERCSDLDSLLTGERRGEGG